MKKLIAVWTAISLLIPTGSVFAKEEYLKVIPNAAPAVVEDNGLDIKVEEFSPSLPAVEDMNLNIKDYKEIADEATRTAVSVLAAKGYLSVKDSQIYNKNLAMDVQAFNDLLLTVFHLEEPVWQIPESLTKATAMRMIGDGCEHYRKMYHWNSDQKNNYLKQYNDIKKLDEATAEAVYSAVRMGLITPASKNMIGINGEVSHAEAVRMIYTMLYNTDLIALGKGAVMPFTEYETEYCETNGNNMVSTGKREGFAFEAIGGTTTQLQTNGDYIKCANVPASNRIMFRFSLPNPHLKYDSSGNVAEMSDYTALIGAYVNGQKMENVELSAHMLHGQRDTTAGVGIYNKKTYIFAWITDLELKAGDTFELRVDEDSWAEAYYIDSIFFEMAEPVIEKPEGFLSICDFGAVPNDERDDSEAIAKTVQMAEVKGTGVYFPAGEFILNEMIWMGSNLTIQGAGIFHTTIKTTYVSGINEWYWNYGGRGSFGVNGDNVTVSDFRMLDEGHWTRTGGNNGLHAFVSRDMRCENFLLEDMIIENTCVGTWISTKNSMVRNVRVYHTIADGIHFDSTAIDSVAENNYMLGTGDDGYAAAATKSDTDIDRTVRGITFRNSTIRQVYWGRGIMMEGAWECEAYNNVIYDVCTSSGIKYKADKNYTVPITGRVSANDNILIRCGTNSSPNAAIMVETKGEGYWADADFWDNEIYESPLAGLAVADQDYLFVEFANNIVQDGPGGEWKVRTGSSEKTVENIYGNLHIPRD